MGEEAAGAMAVVVPQGREAMEAFLARYEVGAAEPESARRRKIAQLESWLTTGVSSGGATLLDDEGQLGAVLALLNESVLAAAEEERADGAGGGGHDF